MLLFNLLQNNIHFEDKGFPASNAPKRDEGQWRRIGQIQDKSCKGKESWTIFRNPSPDDAIQGEAENCWYGSPYTYIAIRLR